MLAYSAGLRVNEVVKLRVQDIDTKIYIHVSQRDIGRIKNPLDFKGR